MIKYHVLPDYLQQYKEYCYMGNNQKGIYNTALIPAKYNTGKGFVFSACTSKNTPCKKTVGHRLRAVCLPVYRLRINIYYYYQTIEGYIQTIEKYINRRYLYQKSY